MSTSQSSQEQFDIENVPQQQQDHIKQVLLKGKSIAPFYDQNTLWTLYKQYFSVQQVFYNQLELTAKKRNADAQNQGGWISVGKSKNKNIQTNKYNFLEDFQLIKRANQLLYSENNDKKQYVNKYKQKIQEKGNKTQKVQYHQNIKHQKVQYKPKENQQHQQKNKPKLKYKQKQTQNEAINEKISKPKQYQQKKSQNKEKLNSVTKYKQKDNFENNGKNQNKNPSVKQSPKKNKFIEKTINKQKQQPKKSQITKFQSEIQEISKGQVQQNFKKQCQKNKYILPFLVPTGKVQKISYVLRNGEIEEVKTRLVLQN